MSLALYVRVEENLYLAQPSLTFVICNYRLNSKTFLDSIIEVDLKLTKVDLTLSELEVDLTLWRVSMRVDGKSVFMKFTT